MGNSLILAACVVIVAVNGIKHIITEDSPTEKLYGLFLLIPFTIVLAVVMYKSGLQ